MRKSSKILWIALAVVAMVFVMTVGAMASVQSTAVVYGVADVGEAATFAVDYNFKDNNTDVECGKITLTWDSAKISADSIVAGAALEGADVESKIEKGKAVIAWAGSAIDAKTAEGELFTVNFKKVAFAEGSIAAIDVSVDNFGFVGAFVTYELAGDVAANKVYASDANFDGVWDADVAATTDPAVFLSVAAQENVDVTLKADMVFTNGGYVNEGGVVSEEHTVNITSESGDSLYSIKVPGDKIVYFDGYYSFNNVNVVGYTSSNFSGGCFQFNKGMGKFGHDETNDDNNFGTITNVGGWPHLAGHVEVWAGNYWTISGNHKGSEYEVENPSITIGGSGVKREIELVIGGSSENSGKNKVKGESYVRVTDEVLVKKLMGGSWWPGEYSEQDGGTVDIDGNPTIRDYLIAGSMGESDMADGAKYVLNINGGIIKGYTAGHLFTTGDFSANATVNTVININGGKFNGVVVGGAYASAQPAKDGVKHKVYGRTELNINTAITKEDGTFVEVTGGSYLRFPNSMHAAESFVNIKNITATGANLFVTAGSVFDSNSGGSVHSGTTTVTATNINKISGGSISNFRMGSEIKSASEHSGDVVATLTNCIGDNRLIGGSYITHKDGVHSGDSTVTVKGTSASFPGGVIGGSFLYAGTHSGNSKFVIDLDSKANSFTSLINGGSSLRGDGAEHSGTSEVVIKSGTVSSGYIYGGSELIYPTGKQTGFSKVVLDGANAYVTSGTVYGGSMATAFAETINSSVHVKGAYGHLNGSSIEILNGVLNGNNIYGGSNLGYQSEWLKQGYVVHGVEGQGHKTSIKITSNTPDANGRVVTGRYIFASSGLGYPSNQYADAEIYSDTPAKIHVTVMMGAGTIGTGSKIVGNCKVDLNNSVVEYSTTTSPGLYGGIYGYGDLVGDSMLKATNCQIKHTATGGVMYVIGGSRFDSAAHKMTGNSALILDGTKVDSNKTWKIVAGGCYGNCTMVGNSTLTLSGNTDLSNGKDGESCVLTAGCYGSGVPSASVDPTTGIYGGIRQTGNVEFNVSGTAKVDMETFISGRASNVDGDLTINISGNPTFSTTKNFVALGYGSNYSSITGNLKIYVSGGTFTKDFYCGGGGDQTYSGINGYSIVGGDIYTEISGGSFFRVRACGDNGGTGNVVLKFVGDNFTLPGSGIYTTGWVAIRRTQRAAGARDIIDLSLATNPSKFTSSNIKSKFTVAYPAFADANALTVTLDSINNKNRTAGEEFLVDADTLDITYTTGAYDGSAYVKTYSGTVGALCEFDKYASSEAAKTINGLKTYDAATDTEFDKLPTYVNTVYVKAGNAQSATFGTSNFKNSFRLAGASMYLDNAISLFYTVDPAVTEAGYTNLKVKVTFTNPKGELVEKELPAETNDDGEYVVTNGRYRFWMGLYPKQMSEDLDAVLCATDKNGDEVYSAVQPYGAFTFVANTFKKSTSTTEKKLLVALCDYADKDMLFDADYKNEELVSSRAGFTDQDKIDFATLSREPKDLFEQNYTTISNPKVEFKSANLRLEDTIDTFYSILIKDTNIKVDDLRVNFKILGADDKTVLKELWYTHKQNNFEYNTTNSRYYIRFEDLISTRIGNRILVTVYVGDEVVSNTLSYSVESFVARNIVKDGKSQEEIDLCRAVVTYGDAVKAHNPNP